MNTDLWPSLASAPTQGGSKTPLGIRSRAVLDKERCQEILQAMLRYMEADIVPPGEWQGELMHTLNRLRDEQPKGTGGVKR